MKLLDGYVKSPFAGLAPWVLMAVVAGPGRFEEAASAALGLALLTLWLGSRRGVRVHALEVLTIAYFGILAVLGLVAPDGVIDWLQLWAGELSNIVLAVFAVGTLILRRPFTMAYAKDTTPREHWNTEAFRRINYAISGAWATAFVVSAVAGAIGDAVLGDNDNFWTAWIIPIGAVVFATAFTEFYPDYATGESASWAGAVDWLPPFLTVTGVVGWVSDAVSDTIAITLIVIGVVGSAAVRRFLPEEPKTTVPQ
jgi:multisubunit Na+/H+ antiporter MnhF subunit